MMYIPFFGTRFGTPRSKPVKGGLRCNIVDHGKVDDLGLNDTQDSFESDPSWELPSLDESEEKEHREQEHDQEVDGREKLCTYEEDSWQILVPKSLTKKEENKTFFELQSFWRKKENEEICKRF
ncbi:hypothetical protein NC652_025855 [Populus alba x Populus x berolinensis]|nr:hypothetical protein NC652_025855 [Populus alba x Populus x berolinensis]